MSGIVRCGSKNRHQKGIMSSKEIGLHAQNLVTMLGLILNMLGGSTLSFNEKENIHLVIDKILQVPKVIKNVNSVQS